MKLEHVEFDGNGDISTPYSLWEGDGHLNVVIGLAPRHLGMDEGCNG